MKKANIKKTISLLLAVALSVGAALSPLPAFAEEGTNAVNGNSTVPNDPESGGDTPITPPISTPSQNSDIYINIGGDVFITDYRVVDYSGRALSKVVPGDKFIVAVNVYDGRIGGTNMFPDLADNQETKRVHANMSQGAFKIDSANSIRARKRRSNGNDGFLYTLEFRDVTYLGGDPKFEFTVGYVFTDADNQRIAVPNATLSCNINQAVDDIPSPQVILTSANYGSAAIAGASFSLATSAVNTSPFLDLDNVAVKVVLPTGLSMSSGNSQVLIGKVGKKGAINHTFNLLAENNMTTEITSLPVSIVYTFEAFVNGQRQQFTSQQDISIKVVQPIKFEIQSSNAPEEGYVGEVSDATVNLVNKGKTTVYNVSVQVEGRGITAGDVDFLGNINAGSSLDSSVEFTPDEAGNKKCKIIVTYEDANGDEYTLERDFEVNVIEMTMPDNPIEPPIVEPEAPKSNTAKYVVGAIAVLRVVAGVVIHKKKKAKKEAEELEDNDEDI
jgi:hypothetical protein